MGRQSPSSSCASEGETGMMLLADTAVSLSNRDKAAKFFDSSSYLATKNQEVHNIGDEQSMLGSAIFLKVQLRS